MFSRTQSMLTTKAQTALAWSSVFCGRQDSLIEGHAPSKRAYAAVNPEGAT